MEDGWILAQALAYWENDTSKALPMFDAIRLPYYSRMYEHLASEADRRAAKLKALQNPTFDDRVKAKIITDGGKDMSWIYQHDIGVVWKEWVERLEKAS